METLSIIQVLSKIGKILSKISYIFCLIGAVGCAIGIACLPFADTGVLGVLKLVIAPRSCDVGKRSFHGSCPFSRYPGMKKAALMDCR